MKPAYAFLAVCVGALLATIAIQPARGAAQGDSQGRRNILFILMDDMRYDTMSCMHHPFMKTPNMDRLAASGVRFRNAFVTTSLCSPSRASFLTGIYAHRHGVFDNRTRLDPKLPTYPQLLQQAGYRTAFFGKWHMGYETDQPQPGFDHWASFKGQGNYVKNSFNINGQHTQIDGYVTDVITDMAVDWIKANRDKPFLAVVHHKAVHAMFIPAERHRDLYADVKIALPPSSLDTPENYFRRPRWVREQRDSWHGINDAYYKEISLDQFIRDYCRALQAADDSVGKLIDTLEQLGLRESTLIVFTSDNGFLFGEHGLIDKRCMYEESIRIPMIMSCPSLYKGGQVLDPMVLNIDVAPTFVEAAGLPVPGEMQGRSFLQLPNDPNMPWRKSFLYEYFWEVDYPETPTVLGVRTDRYKYMEYQGVWDANELYDLQDDPQELHNRISTSRRKVVTPDPEYAKVYEDLRKELRDLTAKLGCRDWPTWKK